MLLLEKPEDSIFLARLPDMDDTSEMKDALKKQLIPSIGLAFRSFTGGKGKDLRLDFAQLTSEVNWIGC
jgi:hypothetical protein